jgi:DNA invertase Pin-like site-specific DNA recombinase
VQTVAIALYMRVSTIDKQDHASQEAALTAWEKGQTGPVVWYKDKASGKDTNRAGFQAMMRDVSRGKVTRIVVAALDRLGRNTRDFLAFIDDLKAKGVGFLSLREGLDPFTPMGEFVLTCMMAMAKLEREHIRSRVNAGIAAARAEGKVWGGRKPGTRIKVTLEKEQAIHRMNADNVPKSEIARVLGLTRRTIYLTLRKATGGTT